MAMPSPAMQWKDPPEAIMGIRARFPYEESVEMLKKHPGKWLMLREGKAPTMEQFVHRYKKVAVKVLPKTLKLEIVTASPEGVTYPTGTLTADRDREVYARVIKVTPRQKR